MLSTLGHPDSTEELRASLVIELAQTGIADNIGHAHRITAAAVLVFGWYGYIDGAVEPTACMADSITHDESVVDRALPCVYAILNR